MRGSGWVAYAVAAGWLGTTCVGVMMPSVRRNRKWSDRPRSPRSAATSKRPGVFSVVLFCLARRGGHDTAAPLGADRIRAIVCRRAADVDGIAGRIGGHSLRVGSVLESLPRTGPASRSCSRRAAGYKSPTTPGVYIRREAAARGLVARRRVQGPREPCARRATAESAGGGASSFPACT